MMKRTIAIIMSLALLLCAAAAAAETAEKVRIGTVSINGAFTLQCGLPEGYTPSPVSVTPSQVIAVIKSEDPDAPVMYLSVAYDEMYADVERMNDLTQEDLNWLEETYIMDDPGVEITYGETGYGTLLLIARHETEDYDYVAFFSVYKGYAVEFVLAPSGSAADKNLTEEQLRISVDFLTDLDFIPAGQPVVSRRTFAGQAVTADLTDYDAEANTLQAEIKMPVLLDNDVPASLEVGDTLRIGSEEITVETVEKDETGAIVNGEISLDYTDEGVRVSMFEREYTYTVATLTLEVPEGLVFLDHIDPATGDILEEPVQHTAAEFVEMLAGGEGPDFSSENVKVTFDEDGEMVQVDRYYTPWQ